MMNLYRRRRVGATKIGFVMSVRRVADIMSELTQETWSAERARRWLRGMDALVVIGGTSHGKYHVRYGTTVEALRRANPDLAFAIEREAATLGGGREG